MGDLQPRPQGHLFDDFQNGGSSGEGPGDEAGKTRGEQGHIHNLHNTIMQSILGGSLHKNNTSYLLLGLYHASVNKISIVFNMHTNHPPR